MVQTSKMLLSLLSRWFPAEGTCTDTHGGDMDQLTIAPGIFVASARILSFCGTVCAVFDGENRKTG
jgi:hypothetical protein